MVAGHYQPLADDGAQQSRLHRPTKPVLCSRVRRQRQASWYGGDLGFLKSSKLVCLRPL